MRSAAVRFFLCCIAAGIFAFLEYHPWQPWQRLVYAVGDTKFPAPELSVSDHVVFVEIDAAAEHRLGRWPWNRDKLAAVLEKILSPARLVGLDLYFPANSNPEEDRILAETVSQMGNVIGGIAHANTPQQPLSDDAIDIISASLLLWKNRPFNIPEISQIEHDYMALLAAAQAHGILTLSNDEDNQFRKYPLAFNFGEMNDLPSLGVQLLQLHLDKQLEAVEGNRRYAQMDDKRIPLSDEARVRLQYYPLSSYPRVGLVDLLDDPQAAAKLSDKIVILGFSEGISGSDMKSTPVGRIPGPLIHLTFISNYLQDHFLTERKDIAYAAYVAAVLVVFGLSWMPHVLIRMCLYLGTVVAFLFFDRHLFSNLFIYLDVLGPLAAFGASCIVSEATLHSSQELTVKRTKRSILGLDSDPETTRSFAKRVSRLMKDGSEVNALLLAVRWPQTMHSATKANNKPGSQTLLYTMAADHGGILYGVSPAACNVVFGLERKTELKAVFDLLSLLHTMHYPESSAENLDALSHAAPIAMALHSGPVRPAIFDESSLRMFGPVGAAETSVQHLASMAASLSATTIFAFPDSISISDQSNWLARPIPVCSYWREIFGHNHVIELLPASSRNLLLMEKFLAAFKAVKAEDLATARSLYHACASRYRDPVASALLRLLLPQSTKEADS